MTEQNTPPQGPGQQAWPSEQPRPNAYPYAAPVYQPSANQGPVPLWAPLYEATLPEAVGRFFKKYATFSGRASRSEYWWWALVAGIFGILLTIIMNVAGTSGATVSANGTTIPGPGYWVVFFIDLAVTLALLIPNLALSVRRLHDTSRSGWMYLLILIPIVGPILILIFMAMAPKPEGQRFDRPQA